MPGTSQPLTNLTFTRNLWARYQCLHSTDEETEAEFCQRSHSQEVGEAEFRFGPVLLIGSLHYQRLISEGRYNISEDRKSRQDANADGGFSSSPERTPTQKSWMSQKVCIQILDLPPSSYDLGWFKWILWASVSSSGT